LLNASGVIGVSKLRLPDFLIAVMADRQRVWLRLTEAERSAYRGHVAALHRIVGRTRA
jgi:hypothetical protein